MGRRWMTAVALVMLGIGLSACGGEVAANNLEIGDCVEDESSLLSAEIEAVDCGDEHLFELMSRFDVDDGDFPGEDELTSAAEDGCTGSRFEDYVGEPYNPAGGAVLAFPLLPSEESWNDADDRTILCFAVPGDRQPTTGSVQG